MMTDGEEIKNKLTTVLRSQDVCVVYLPPSHLDTRWHGTLQREEAITVTHATG